MSKKRLILSVGLFLIVFFVILLPTLLIIMDTKETKESNNGNEECNPIVKHREEYHITLTFWEDYFLLNYTMSSNMTYWNLITEFNQFEYPFVYAVSSDMFEKFSRAVEDPYFDHYEDPILEYVYQFETYNQYNIFGNFTLPYLDQWFIFICNNHCGPNRFTYHDRITQSCL